MANVNEQAAAAALIMLVMMFNLAVISITQRNILLLDCLNRFEAEMEALNRAKRKRKSPKEWMTLQCVSLVSSVCSKEYLLVSSMELELHQYCY